MSRSVSHFVAGSLFLALTTVSAARSQQPAPGAKKCDSLCIVPTRTISFETTTGTQMNVDISPDGRTVLFDLLGDLYTMPRGGGSATRLTSGMAIDGQPVFSPDGKRILFVSDRSGNENLWVMNADGTNLTAITKERGDLDFESPEWSPDGEYVLVRKGTSPYIFGGRQAWLYHVSGGKGMELAKKSEGTGFRWSPNGRYVYFRGTETGAAQIKRVDRVTGDVATITSTPSGAARPAISPDGKWMAYLTTVDAKNGLRLRNLETDDDQWLAYPIDFEGASHLTRFTFAPDGSAVLFTRNGTFQEIDVRTKRLAPIGFTAKVEQRLGPRIYHEFPFRDDSLVVRNVRYGGMSPDRSRLVFGSLNQIWSMDLPNGRPRLLVEGTGGQYQPTFSPDGSSLAYVSWDENKGGQIWRMPARGGASQRLTTTQAYYANLTWSPDGARIAFVREDPAATRSRDTRNTGLIQWIASTGGPSHDVVSAPSDNNLSFTSDGSRVTFTQGDSLVSVRLDGTDRRIVARAPRAVEMVPSPDGRWLAFTVREEIYVAALPPSAEPATITEAAGPGPVRRVSREGGEDLRWDPSGKTLSWVFANTFSYLDLDKVFGPGTPDSTTVDRATTVPIRLLAAMPKPDGVIAFKGATVVTMRGDEVLRNATVVVTRNRISAVGPSGSVRVPAGARVIDASGKTIIPGLIDGHAHIRGMPRDVLVQAAPEPLVNLAFGVTMARDVNASTDQFHYRELIAAGRMLGPRIFMTGPSQTPDAVKIESYEDARAGVHRYARRGSVSIKQYLQPQRRQINWMLQAADELGINATAEGGTIMHQVAMVLDGYTAFEHAPIDQVNVYDDVIQLFARSKTMYTPTLIVASPLAYQGENYWYQTTNVHDNAKLNRFLPHEAIDRLTRTGTRYALDEYYFLHGGAGAAPIIKAGGNVGAGGHGQIHGLAVHWEIWMLQLTGMTNHEALRAATIMVADGLGMRKDFGSLEAGKVADLLVLDRNPLVDIRNTTAIRYVMQGGHLYDGETLAMVWPKQRPLPPFRYRDFGPPPKADWIDTTRAR